MLNIRVIGADALEKIGVLARGSRKKLMEDLVTESRRFGNLAVLFAKKNYLRGPRPKLVNSEGLLKSSIKTATEVKGNNISTSIGSDIVYAAIHEMGGETHPNVTDRMRSYMWFMFYKTKDDKFKRMALTKKTQLTIKIPSRPYLRPSLMDAIPSFKENIGTILKRLNFVGA